MGLFSKLFGGGSASKTATGKAATPAKPTAQDLMAQRQALVNKVMTGERQERLAQAFEVQAAKQQLKQQLKSDAGQRELAAKLQRLMKGG